MYVNPEHWEDGGWDLKMNHVKSVPLERTAQPPHLHLVHHAGKEDKYIKYFFTLSDCVRPSVKSFIPFPELQSVRCAHLERILMI